MTRPSSSFAAKRFLALITAAVLAILLATGGSDRVIAKPTSSKLDKTFGSGGMTRIPAPSARSSDSTACFEDKRGNIWALTSLTAKKRGRSTDQLTKLTRSGRTARGFGRRGFVQLTRISDVQQTADGGFLVLRTPQSSATREHVITRLTKAGRVDKQFASKGSLRTGIKVGNNRDVGFEALPDGRFVLILNTGSRNAFPLTELQFFDRHGRRDNQMNTSPLSQSGRYISDIHGLPGGGWVTSSSERTGATAGVLELQSFDSAGVLDAGWGTGGKALAEPPASLVEAARRYADWGNTAALTFRVGRVVTVLADGRTLVEGSFFTDSRFDDARVAVAFVVDQRGRWDVSFGTGGGRLLWIESESDADGQFAGEDRELTVGHRGEIYTIEDSWTEADTSSVSVTKFDRNGRGAQRILSSALIKRASVKDVVPATGRKRVYVCASSGKDAYVAALKSR